MTRLLVGPSDIQISARASDLAVLQKCKLALGPTQPSIQWVAWFFPRGKAASDEADYASLSSAKVKNE